MSFEQILAERIDGQRRQFHLSRLAPFAAEVKLGIAAFVEPNVAQSGTNEFVCSQSCRISEVQEKAHSPRGRHGPAIRPVEAICEGP